MIDNHAISVVSNSSRTHIRKIVTEPFIKFFYMNLEIYYKFSKDNNE